MLEKLKKAKYELEKQVFFRNIYIIDEKSISHLFSLLVKNFVINSTATIQLEMSHIVLSFFFFQENEVHEKVDDIYMSCVLMGLCV